MLNKDDINSTDFYYCYSKSISDLLKKHDIYYILKAKSVRDDKIFTLYLKTDKLMKLLKVEK